MSWLIARIAAICAVLAFGPTVSVTNVTAQTAAQVKPPGTVRPGQVERQFEKPPEPSAKPGVIAIPTPGQTPPPNADGIRFVLTQFTIDGVTVYTADTLRRFYADVLQKEVTLADVYRIVDSITARYRNDGYILSQVIVPAQSIEDGSIRLQAIEGYVADVRVEGGTAELRDRVRPYGEKIRGRRPLTAARLERYVLLVNDLPGVQARVVLAPAQTAGASDLVLQVSPRRIRAGLSVDNRGSEAQGLQRVFGDAGLNNLIGASLTELRQVTTLTPEMTYVAVAHDQFLGTHGGRLGLAGSYVYSRPQELAVVPLDLTTRSRTLSATYTHPLVRSRSRNLSVRAGLSAFDSASTVFEIEDSTDRLRAARVGVTYDVGDAWGGVTIADAEFSQGISGLGATANGDAYLSRPGGRVDFQKVTLYASRIQGLLANWSVVIATNAQYALTDLLAPELFSIGGEQFGRGYDPSEFLNDHGVAMKIDLRYVRAVGRTRQALLVPYGFVDGGRVWQRTPVAGIGAAQSATSAGIGLRVQAGSLLSGFVEFATPIGGIVQAENTRARFRAGLAISRTP
jgi:hemolysin activation/secretion protein